MQLSNFDKTVHIGVNDKLQASSCAVNKTLRTNSSHFRSQPDDPLVPSLCERGAHASLVMCISAWTNWRTTIHRRRLDHDVASESDKINDRPVKSARSNIVRVASSRTETFARRGQLVAPPNPQKSSRRLHLKRSCTVSQQHRSG